MSGRPTTRTSRPTAGSPTARFAAASVAELSEKDWQRQVVELARLVGWQHVYHTHDSRRSAHGFPDLALVRERLILVELKRETTRPTDAQTDWLTALAAAGAEVYLWRPSDLDEIGQILAGRVPLRWRWSDAAWTPRSLWTPDGHRHDQSAATAAQPQRSPAP